MKKFIAYVYILSCTLASCTGSEKKEVENKGKNEVKIHELSDPTKLNPLISTDETSSEIAGNIFQSLLTYDPETYEEKPYLAKATPAIIVNADSSMDFTFELKDEAKWGDGSAIVASDVEFSLKVIKNSFIDCAPLRVGYEKFTDFKIDDANPKKFTVHCVDLYHAAKLSIGGLIILNPKAFDPKGLMKRFTLKQLSTPSSSLSKEETSTLTEYAKFFNESFNNSLPAEAGSGAYQFEKWETFQRVILVKRKNWWANALKTDSLIFHAYPNKLIYETVNDLNTAVVALKAGELDVMKRVPPRDFVQDMKGNTEVEKKLALFTPPFFAYEYIDINMKNKKFEDLRVRKAFSHLVDIDKIISSVYYGLGERVASFIHPSKKEYYNTAIQLPDFNIEKAKALLAQAGWKDTNGDGVVDKIINGEKTEMEVNIMFNNGNDRRKKICVYFLEAAKAAGVKVIIQPKDFSKMLEDLSKHDFELCVGGWGSSPLESDPKQIWHSTSYNDGGSNHTGFGDAQSDMLIEKIRTTIDQNQRAIYYKELQRLISEAVPCIFLLAQKERIAISKRWNNAKGVGMSPGYDASSFQLK